MTLLKSRLLRTPFRRLPLQENHTRSSHSQERQTFVCKAAQTPGSMEARLELKISSPNRAPVVGGAEAITASM